MVMEDERREDIKPSYWLDACEDISCDLIDDLVSDFDPSSVAVHESVDDNGVNNDFFGGIDHILDSIKNGGGLPNNGISETNSRINEVSGTPQLIAKEITVSVKENGLQKCGGKRDEVSKEEGDKNRKRARVCSYQSERSSLSGRGQVNSRDRDRFTNRKRPRNWGEAGQNKKRDCYNYRRDGSRDREVRGYWERDKVGSNELVYRSGTWEADHERYVKKESGRKRECNVKAEENKSKPEERKEKVVEEQARRYQLDVLEQAKAKNTIAFLETGAGKTLIAILLSKSIHKDLMSQNRKMLSVFLVPKVPLVYQVSKQHTCLYCFNICYLLGLVC